MLLAALGQLLVQVLHVLGRRILIILAKYLTTARITVMKRLLVDSEADSRADQGNMEATENELAVAGQNEQIQAKKKESLEKQIEKLTKELGSLNV